MNLKQSNSMNQKVLFTCFMLLIGFNQVKAQEKTEFQTQGKVIARGFVHVNSHFLDMYDGVNLDVSRAYLGYNYMFTPNLQATILGDFATGKDKNGRFTPTLKNAFLQWHQDKLILTAGLIGLYQFRDQESYWGHRYTYKSFQDQYKFGHSADFGIAFKYQIIDPLSIDFSFTNGEGYKTIRKNKNNRYALGLSLHPIKNLLVRAYADIYNDSLDPIAENLNSKASLSHQYSFAFFLAYKNKHIKTGLEYNLQLNNAFSLGNKLFGYSAYCTVVLADKWNCFARFDLLKSSNKGGDAWDKRDGQVAILGFEYKPWKSICLAPNFRFGHNDKTKKKDYALFVNLEFRLR